MDTPKPIASLRLLHYWSFFFFVEFLYRAHDQHRILIY